MALTGQTGKQAAQSMHRAGSINIIGSSGEPRMQSTGHVATHAWSLTQMHASVMTKVTAVYPFSCLLSESRRTPCTSASALSRSRIARARTMPALTLSLCRLASTSRNARTPLGGKDASGRASARPASSTASAGTALCPMCSWTALVSCDATRANKEIGRSRNADKSS